MKRVRVALSILLMSVALAACIKESFENPPDSTKLDPNLPVNVTIAQLSNMIYSAGSGSSRVFTGDSTIYGIVTADDRSGNFYKQIVIQDSTGGIVIGLATYNLFADYPVGRKVYVKLKGLTLVDYKGIPEIVFSANSNAGSLTLTGIPPALISSYLVKASYPNVVTPLQLSISEIQHYGQAFLVNRLVNLVNMEFDSTAVGQTYAQSSIISAGTNRVVHDCYPADSSNPVKGYLTMYNSGYATFQPAIIPSGKGTLTCIYSVYNTTPQVLIRDSSDVHFSAPRECR